MNDSIFTKIIKGEIPSHKVYEDDKTLAFLDIHPVAAGHTLVVPKTQVEFVWDLSDEDYEAVMATSKKVAIRLRDVMGKPYVGERIIGTDVPHAHVQLIPFATTDELHKNVDMDAEPDHEALATVAEKLRF
jgi:histidine triad (HIT) family protein